MKNLVHLILALMILSAWQLPTTAAPGRKHPSKAAGGPRSMLKTTGAQMDAQFHNHRWHGGYTSNSQTRVAIMDESCPYIKVTDFGYGDVMGYNVNLFRIDWLPRSEKKFTAFKVTMVIFDEFNGKLDENTFTIPDQFEGAYEYQNKDISKDGGNYIYVGPAPHGAANSPFGNMPTPLKVKIHTVKAYISAVVLSDGTIWQAPASTHHWAETLSAEDTAPQSSASGASDSAPPNAAASCPAYNTMLTEGKALKKLANALETDDHAYHEAVADIVLQGYNSDYARLGLDVDEDQVGKLFADEASIQAARSGLVKNIRSKAIDREAIATAGLTQDYAIVPLPRLGIASYLSKESVLYFCSHDPDKLSDGAWEGLYKAGYIDYPVYRKVHWKNVASSAFDTAVNVLLLKGAWGLTGAKLLSRLPFQFGGLATELDALETRTLAGVAEKKLLDESSQALGQLIESRSAEAVNAEREAFFESNGGVRGTWIPEWQPGTEVQKILMRRPFKVYRVFTKDLTKSRASWFTEETLDGLSPEEIQAKFSLPWTPTDVITAEIKEQATIYTGFSVGGGRQILVTNFGADVTFDDASIQSLPLGK